MNWLDCAIERIFFGGLPEINWCFIVRNNQDEHADAWSNQSHAVKQQPSTSHFEKAPAWIL